MSNYQQEELEKFNQLADEWWNPEGPMKPLHQLNPLRLKFIENISSLPHKNILDVGCGAGLLTEALATNIPFKFPEELSLNSIPPFAAI